MAGQQKSPIEDAGKGPGFFIANQKVFLDLDIRSRHLKGKTEITVLPRSGELRVVRLNCRQLSISSIQIGRRHCTWKYADPYEQIKLPYQGSARHHQKIRERLGNVAKYPAEPELEITLPKTFKITEAAESSLLLNGGAQNGVGAAAIENVPRFEPFTLAITFEASKVHDGLHFVGWDSEDLRYPHVFTRSSPRGSPASLFPCIETLESKCTWEILIRSPRTLADAIGESASQATNSSRQVNGDTQGLPASKLSAYSNEDRALDLLVICSGDLTDEIVDPLDATKKTSSFTCILPVSALHVGFAVGPFEAVNLAAFRDSDEDDKLGRNAITIHGFCLPGRGNDLRNACYPLAKAMDYFVVEFGSYPFPSYKLCFVDDMEVDQYDTATLTICSNRLLFPENIIDPLDHVTRELVHGLASQWAGVHITPQVPQDLWAVIGMSYFITDMFLRRLCGNNEYRFMQKRLADQTCDLDIAQPSIYECGLFAWTDEPRYKLLATKAPLVLFILDRRLAKSGGSTGLSRIITKIFLQTNVGEIVDGSLSTAHFIRICERLGHTKLEGFFNQWVHGCGCPRFRVTQRFNKKRLVIEMQISQSHQEDAIQDLQASTFMRSVKENERGIVIESPPQTFTGPMTIRIHEADGTPYEHIVEIKEATTRFDIPYNTKYKRLKRNRRQRERAFLGGNHDAQVDGQEDILLYCLGDVLQSEEEMRDWRFVEWSKEDEERMNGESYEWIRMDADFEWICQMTINMPGYMYVSQLQQDRDVVAQYETVQYLTSQKAHPLVSTILTRTLMDNRYFHGIRTLAAAGISNHAREEINWLGWFHLDKAFRELFCLDGSAMPQSNDFSNRALYFVQCAIPRSVARIRDRKGRAPITVRRFLNEKLHFNDNSNNEFSDCYYLALLMEGLADTVASAPILDTDDMDMDDDGDDYQFLKSCLDEIERYRRLDEWIPSYRNVISVTAVRCRMTLARSGILDPVPTDFLVHTRAGDLDEIRVAAFESLGELGFVRSDPILRWLLHVAGHDPSPFVRARLFGLFGRLIGGIALGEGADATAADHAGAPADGLIVEQDATTDARKAERLRKSTVSGAVAALKATVGASAGLQAGLWDALSSPNATISEVLELLTLCGLLYEQDPRVLVTLHYPRYWTVAGTERAPVPNSTKPRLDVHFKKNGPFRWNPVVRPPPTTTKPPPTTAPPAKAASGNKRASMSGLGGGAAKPLFTLTHKAAQKARPAAGAVPGTATSPPAGEEKKQKIKIRMKLPKTAE